MKKTHPNLRRRTFFTPLLMPVLAGALTLALLLWLYLSITTTTVILVRHAEKFADAGSDPGLTEAGEERALLLARMFADAGIDALFASQFRRTQATLVPLAEMLSLEPGIIDAEEPEVLVREILANHRGDMVLVVGHSNTLPQLIKRLSGVETKPIDESDYTGIYILTLPRFGDAQLLRLNYPQ